MLSRVASSVYWLNRYMERAENYSRFVDVNQQLMMDLDVDAVSQWMPLVYTTGDHELFQKKYGSPTPRNVILFLTFDQDNPNSIYSCLVRARENARTIRENISQSMWETLNEFYLEVKYIRSEFLKNSLDENISLDMPLASSYGDNLFDFFKLIRRNCQTFYGMTDSTINHDDVYHFAKIGRNLERADKSTRILDMKYFILLPNSQEVGSTLDLIQWLSVLKSASAQEMYNKIYPKIVPLNIAEFIIQNPQFPRSIHFCLEEIRESIDKVSGLGMQDYSEESPNRQVNKVLKDVAGANMVSVFQSGFHEYIDGLQSQLNDLGNSIQKRFFET
ncbi:MAG: alpha-E domain-containing protein [Leptospira sp.]|nr:alpha-E domain-containing protein [Leptospira sp.]